MSAQTTVQPAASRIRVGPLPLLVIASVAFAAGLGVASLNTQTSATTTGAAAPTFDAVQFHAGERGPLVATPTFDAVRFRAEERGD